MTSESVEHIISVIREKGTNAWFDPEIPDEVWVSPNLKATGEQYRRGTETMDIWFDSGTSWSMLPPAPLKQADLYLEGTDQHRGWFQSSLLTSLAVQGIAPFKSIITHGFVLDDDSRKMSKSLGNVTSPQSLMDMKAGTKQQKTVIGIGGMRLWIASSSYTTDVSVSEEVLSHVLQNLNKIWITIRYLIGNIGDLPSTELEYAELDEVSSPLFMWVHEGVGSICFASIIQSQHESKRALREVRLCKRLVVTVRDRANRKWCTRSLSILSITCHPDTFSKQRINSIATSRIPSHDEALNTFSSRFISSCFLPNIQTLVNYLCILYPLIPLHVEKAWELVPAQLKSEDAVYKLGWFQPKDEWRNEEVADLIKLLTSMTDPTQLIITAALNTP